MPGTNAVETGINDPLLYRAPRSPQELGTFHLSNIVHLCTKPSDLRPASSLPAGRRAKTSTAVHGAASNWRPSLGWDFWALALRQFPIPPQHQREQFPPAMLAEQFVRGESRL